MNWQQFISLLIVATTAALFLRARLQRPKFSFARATHCGCGGQTPAQPPPSVILRKRKGGPAEIIVKMQ
jgi:hypothetical protein